MLRPFLAGQVRRRPVELLALSERRRGVLLESGGAPGKRTPGCPADDELGAEGGEL